MLADALEHLVRGIVDNPDDVTVTSRSLRRGDLLEVRVNPEDLRPSHRPLGPYCSSAAHSGGSAGGLVSARRRRRHRPSLNAGSSGRHS